MNNSIQVPAHAAFLPHRTLCSTAHAQSGPQPPFLWDMLAVVAVVATSLGVLQAARGQLVQGIVNPWDGALSAGPSVPTAYASQAVCECRAKVWRNSPETLATPLHQLRTASRH